MKRAITSLLFAAIILSWVPVIVAVDVEGFNDVNVEDWYYDAVKFVTGNGMFNGTSAETFSPGDTMERGMFVTVLGRHGKINAPVPDDEIGTVCKSDVCLRSEPTTQSHTISILALNTQVKILQIVKGIGDSSYSWYQVSFNGSTGYIREDLLEPVLGEFSDVPSNKYYSPYVYWACREGIASKTQDRAFAPTRAITREEICSMLYNYASSQKLQIEATVPAETFIDSDSISPEYAQAVAAMQTAGVITGYSDGSFLPQGSATRAEVSIMLMRFVNSISSKPSDNDPVEPGEYTWGDDIAESEPVDADYFSDVCFIGHSITVGMKDYLDFTDSDFYAFNGATAKTILSRTSFSIPGGGYGSLAQALSAKQYGKIYLMIGANECSSGEYYRNEFSTNMTEVINTVQAAQPNAEIYIFSFTPVSRIKSLSGSTWSLDNLTKYNEVIRQLARDNKLHYLNIFSYLADSEGYLPSSATPDGLHLYASEYQKIKSFIYTHTF